MREGRSVIADLRGKEGRIRTVAIAVWVKKGIGVWTSAAGLRVWSRLRTHSPDTHEEVRRGIPA
jgi:hypothetical protein